MRRFKLPELLYNLSRSEMQSNYNRFGAWNYRTKQQFLTQMAKVDRICQESKLLSQPRELIRRINRNERHILEGLGTQVSAIRNEITRQISTIAYFEVPTSDVSLYEQKEPLFGNLVHVNFKSSRYDIAEAGKCMAFDRSTAAVMHLMRALEPALVAMAKDVGYIPTRDVWGKMINEIQERLDPKNANYVKDARKRNFLSPAAVQFRHFKDAWRDHAMHAREKYDHDEARTVFAGVRSFMMYLAKRLKE